MPTLAAFRIRFPEFSQANDPFVNANLTAAALEVDTDAWGAKTDEGVMFLAAHKMALSPFGMNARMVSRDGSTTYWTNYHRLLRQVAFGLGRLT